MNIPVEKIFASCLLAGFIFSLLLFLSAGRLFRFRVRFVPRVRVPRFFPRLRLPRLRLRLPRLRLGRMPKVAAGKPQSGEAATEITAAPPWATPLLFGMFVTVFGASGLVFRVGLGLSAVTSVVLAALCGGGVSVLSVFAFSRFFTETASEVKGNPLLGTIGHVSLSIPEGGVGAIAYVVEGKRVTMPAKSKDGRALPQGKRIMVVDIKGRVAVVEEF